MEKILIFIKHNFSFLWKIIEFINSFLLQFLYKKRIQNVLHTFKDYNKIDENYKVKILNIDDLDTLFKFITTLYNDSFKYFNPHLMDKKSLKKVLENYSMLKFGFYDKENNLVGYFILRLFFNKKCFIGRLVHPDFRGQGIAKKMAKILYCVSKQLDFNVYSTISKNNIASLKSHHKINNYTIEKEFDNGFYLIRFNLKDYEC